MFQHVRLDTTQPALILSEFVLAYLGLGGADAIMFTIALDVLCGKNDCSMFACLEAVFLWESRNDSGGGHDGDTPDNILG